MKTFSIPLAYLILLVTAYLTESKFRSTQNALKRRHMVPQIKLNYYIESDSFQSTQVTKFQNVHQFENEFMSKNGSDYVISSSVNAVQFSCEASYPITWKMPHPEQFSGVQSWQIHINSERTSIFHEKLEQPLNQKYYAFLQIQNQLIRTTSQTGHLSCQRLDSPDVQSTIYVFSEGRYLMENMAEVPVIKADSTSTEITIPCRPVLPNIKISLSKLLNPGNSSGATSYSLSQPNSLQILNLPTSFFNAAQKNSSKWDPIALNSSIKFDPKMGFTLDAKQLPNVFGYYKCSVDEDSDDEEDELDNVVPYGWAMAGVKRQKQVKDKFVMVEEGKPLPSTFEFSPKANLNIKAKLTVANSLVQCCSGDTLEKVNGIAFPCQNEAECNFYAPVLLYDSLMGKRYIPSLSKECYNAVIGGHQSRVVFCTSKNMEVAGHYVSASNNADIQSLLNNIQLARTQVKVYDASSDIDPNVLIKFAVHTLRGHHYVHSLHPNLRSEPYYLDRISLQSQRSRYVGRIGAQVLPAQYGSPYLYRRDVWSYVKLAYYLPLTRDMYEGENVAIACSCHAHRYAKGGWLQLNWKNGSRTVFKKISDSVNPLTWSTPSLFDDVNFAMVRTDFPQAQTMDQTVVGKINSLSLEMESIDCFAPVWKTDKWEKRNFPLRIKNSSLPQFEDPLEETVTVRLNQTGIVFNCSLVASTQNIVFPVTITWMKDGKKLDLLSYEMGIGNITTLVSVNSTNSTLQLADITHEMQGRFECIATNTVKGNVTKTFIIFVDDGKRNTVQIIAITLFGVCLLAAIATLALTWKSWRLQVQIGRLLSGSWKF